MSQAVRKSDSAFSSKRDPLFMSLLSRDVTAQELYKQANSPSNLSPERELMVKVLEDALETFTDGRFSRPTESRDRKNRRLLEYREARRWIFAEDDEWIFSFIPVCDWLEINPVRIRELCRRYDREERKKVKKQRSLRHEASRVNDWGRRYVKAGHHT
jgi:hypothetical protein